MIRKIKVTDYPRLIEIWESAVLSTHDFLKEEDFLYYKEQLPVYFQYVTLFGFEQEGILIGFMRIAEGNLEMLFITLKSATTRLYDTEAKIICIVSKKGAQCIECHHKDI